MSRAALGAVLIALIVFATAPALSGDPGVLRVGLPSVPAILDPAGALDGPLPLICRQVFDTLVRYVDAGSDIEPALAAAWSVSKDGLVWSFRLREGVRFHDGTALTAQHVADSLDRVIQPGGSPRAPAHNAAAPRLLRGTPGIVKEIQATDPHTVRITLVLPYAPLLNVLAHPAFSVVLPSSAGGGAAPF